ncbi:MAG: hypothetical protein EB072_18725 [Betaproteobacteria bacterium]|nr:hypothetical protein [Betaproteobacteria bacterium]
MKWEEHLKAAFFEYVRPADVEEALGLKEGHDDRSIFLAGGQSAIPALNMRLNQPNLVIDIGRIEALQGIWAEDGGIRVGALVTHRELGESKIAREYSTIFRDASKLIAHEAIRNKGTIGGSLALADPAAEWPAVCVALNAPRKRAAGIDLFPKTNKGLSFRNSRIREATWRICRSRRGVCR